MFKKVLSAISLMLLLLSVFPMQCGAAAASPITMTVTVGFSGKYVVGKIAPVTVTVRNDGREISGALELRTGDGFSLLVRREVILPQNTEKQFVLYVMASSIYKPKDFEVTLRQGGSVVATAMPKVVNGIDPDKSLCGILSDDPASVGYFKMILFEQTYLKDWIELSASSLYDNAQLLDSFSLIVVDSLDGGSLTDKQYDAVRQWVYSGGTLILGTGPGGEPATGWRELTGGLTGQGSATATGLGRLSSLAQGKELGGTLPVLGLQCDENWTQNARADDGKPLVLSRPFGRGSVYVSAFRLGEGTFAGWQGANLMWMSLLNSGVYSTTQYGKSMYAGGYYGGYGGGGFAQALRQGMAGGSGTFLIFLGVLVLFVIASGFGGFLVLKSMGRQKLMWVVVPAIALLTSGVLLFFGSNSLGRSPYLFAFTATDISGAVGRSEQTLGFVAPTFGKYKIAVADTWLLYPQTLAQYDYYGYGGYVQNPPKQAISAVTSAGGGDIEFLNVNLNGTRSLKFSSFSQQSPLECTFGYDGKAVNCMLKNNSEWPVEDATAIIGSTYQTIGVLAPGESKEFTLRLDQTPLQDGVWMIIDKLYPYAYYGGGPFLSRMAQNKEKSLKGTLMREQINNVIGNMQQGTAGIAQVYCFGWLDKPFGHAVTVNGKDAVPESLEFISAVVPVQQVGDGLKIHKAYAKLSPVQTATNGVMLKGDYLIVEPSKSAVLDYDFSAVTNLAITDMIFETGSRGGSMGAWNIFNWTNGVWDNAVPSQKFTLDDVKKYLSPEGIVRMRLTTGANDYYEGMPYVWVQGVNQ